MPSEFVPGAAALVPRAPPLAVDICDPMPVWADAVPESSRQAITQRKESSFMVAFRMFDDCPLNWTPRLIRPRTIARTIMTNVTEFDVGDGPFLLNRPRTCLLPNSSSRKSDADRTSLYDCIAYMTRHRRRFGNVTSRAATIAKRHSAPHE